MLKENLKLEIQKSVLKIENLEKQANQVLNKLEKLGQELENIQTSIQKEEERIQLLGVKTPSKDPAKPDTSKETQKKEEFNSLLKQEKEEYLSTLGAAPLKGTEDPSVTRLREIRKIIEDMASRK